MSSNPTRDSHTVEGITEIGRVLISAWKSRYYALAESMFEWFDDSGKCDAMFEMTRKHVPEKYLLHNGKVAIFDFAGETHMLPVRESGTLNIYGYPSYWSVVPDCVGTIADEIFNLRLDSSNSVIMQNSLRGSPDVTVINNMVVMMVDSILTLYQRTLCSRNPVIVTVNDMGDSNASNFINGLLSLTPAIVRSAKGATLKVEALDLNAAIDPKLMEAISYFKSQLLIYIGYKATDIHKRAQQSVPETVMPQSEVKARWREKQKCRQQAIDAYNKKFGNQLRIECICEELEEEEGEEEEDVEGEANDIMGAFGGP